MIELSFNSDIDVHSAIPYRQQPSNGRESKGLVKRLWIRSAVNAPIGFSETDYATEAII